MPITGKKLNALERAQRKNQGLGGTGRYEFQNKLNADLQLPKPPIGAKSCWVGPKQKFIGDSYFFSVMRSYELLYIREIEHMPTNDVLLTEQPPVVTQQGTVEFVRADEPLTEQAPAATPERLLVEPAADGVTIVR